MNAHDIPKPEHLPPPPLPISPAELFAAHLQRAEKQLRAIIYAECRQTYEKHEANILNDKRSQLAHYHNAIESAPGYISLLDFKNIRNCLHPDRVTDDGEKNKYRRAFDLIMRLQWLLVMKPADHKPAVLMPLIPYPAPPIPQPVKAEPLPPLSSSASKALDKSLREIDARLYTEIKDEMYASMCARWGHIEKYVGEWRERYKAVPERNNGYISHDDYNNIRNCLHPDRVQDEGLKRKFEQAYQIFETLKPWLAQPKLLHGQFRAPPLPDTLVFRRTASEERARAKAEREATAIRVAAAARAV